MGRKTTHNYLVTEEKKKMFNEENVRLTEEFIVYLQSLGRSQGTIDGYISDLNIAWAYNLDKNRNKSFIDWTKKDVMFFQNYFVNTLKLSGARYRRLRSALSSLSNYIELMLDDEYPNFRPLINKLEAPSKQPVREKSIFTDEVIQELLDKLVERKEYQRACILALAWASGARKSELLRFKVSHIQEEYLMYGSLYKTPEKIKTKGRDGGKMLHKYILKTKFKPYFDLWMKEREEKGIESDWIFVYKSKGKYEQMGVAQANYIANLFSNELGTPFYFHSMRHNFVTELNKQGIPNEVIKELTGHASVDMVQLYNDRTADDTLGEYFNESGIKEVSKKGLGDL